MSFGHHVASSRFVGHFVSRTISYLNAISPVCNHERLRLSKEIEVAQVPSIGDNYDDESLIFFFSNLWIRYLLMDCEQVESTTLLVQQRIDSMKAVCQSLTEAQQQNRNQVTISESSEKRELVHLLLAYGFKVEPSTKTSDAVVIRWIM